MLHFWGDIPNIGKVFIDEVFYFYDEPQIFTCTTNSFHKYFAILTDSEPNYSRWIFVAISEAKLTLLKNNLVEIRSVFTAPESDLVWSISQVEEKFLSETLLPSEITDELLPCEGEFLDCVTGDCFLKPRNSLVADEAFSTHRDVFDLSLEPKNQHIREIPCEVFSRILSNTQDLIFALANKDGGIKGKVPKTILESCQLQVAGTFAASFGVRLKSDALCNLEYETPLTKTITELADLLSISNDNAALREFLSSQSPRVAIKYRNFLNSLLLGDVGASIAIATPNQKFYNAVFSTDNMQDILRIIKSEISNMVETVTSYGKLVGVNIEKQNFVFISVDDELIQGDLSHETASSTFKIPQDIEATLERSIDQDSITRQEKYRYKLIAYKHILD